MKKTALAVAALLAVPAVALGHDMTIRPDCEGVTFNWWGFPAGSYFEHSTTINGQPGPAGSVGIVGNGTYRVNFLAPLFGRHTLRVEARFFSDVNDVRRRDMALNCPPGTPPTAPEPDPNPPVTETTPVPPPPPPPVPTPPPAPEPTPPQPPKPPLPPKKLVCQDLILKRVGEKWLRRAGCVRTPIKACPAGKQRVVVKGKIVCRPFRPVRVAG